MQTVIVHFGIDSLQVEWTSSTVVIGTFDGVHTGHRALLAEAVRLAKSHEQPSVVVTFDRHPLSVLAPDRCPPALGTLEQNVIALREMGLSACVIMPFNAELVQWSAERFLDEVVLGALMADRVVVGHDFAFGHGRQGTPEWLSRRIETHKVPPFLIEGTRVSSSVIRNLVAQGDVVRAGHLLGRPFSLAGIVVRGDKLGRTLGYPTVNLARTIHTVVPKDGIYACTCKTPLGEFQAAASIGVRPAVGGNERRIEAFLINYPGDLLYGDPIALAFHQRLRDEVNFSTLEALKSQISRDVQAVVELNTLSF